MLENSLKIREKYINKLKAKIDSIAESLDLLHKVDTKLVGGGLQRGGLGEDGLKFSDLEQSALKKKREILLQANKLDALNANISKLSEKIKPIKDSLNNVRDLIDSIHIKLPKLNEANVDFESLPLVYQYNIYHNVKANQLASVNDFKDKVGADKMVAFDLSPVDKDGKNNANHKDITSDEILLIGKFHNIENATLDNISASYTNILEKFNASIAKDESEAVPPSPPDNQNNQNKYLNLGLIGGGRRNYRELPNSLTETPY